jgi:hypothetical protein
VAFEQPSTIEIIDKMAFGSCESLSRMSIPASIDKVGGRCFVDCKSLISVTFESPSHLTILEELGTLQIANLEIPDSVEVIRGMTTLPQDISLVVSFGSESKLAIVSPTRYSKLGTGAFVRYPEAMSKRFRANVDDFATLS